MRIPSPSRERSEAFHALPASRWAEWSPPEHLDAGQQQQPPMNVVQRVSAGQASAFPAAGYAGLHPQHPLYYAVPPHPLFSSVNPSPERCGDLSERIPDVQAYSYPSYQHRSQETFTPAVQNTRCFTYIAIARAPAAVLASETEHKSGRHIPL